MWGLWMFLFYYFLSLGGVEDARSASWVLIGILACSYQGRSAIGRRDFVHGVYKIFIYLFFSLFIKVAVLSWSDGYLCLQGEAPVFIPDDLTGGGLDWEIGLKLKDCQRAVNIGNKTVRFCSGKDLNLFYTMGVYYLFNNTNFDCFVIFLIWSVCNRWCWSWITIDNWCFHIWQIYWWMVSVYIYIYTALFLGGYGLLLKLNLNHF